MKSVLEFIFSDSTVSNKLSMSTELNNANEKVALSLARLSITVYDNHMRTINTLRYDAAKLRSEHTALRQ